MTSSESEGHTPPRKRARTSANTNDNESSNKKSRGRPRVDTEDATAVDRRRTQIRLAQRAYRQRKETTIASLKDQTSHLHSVIEQMDETFLRFSEAASRAGLAKLDAHLGHELHRVSETFRALRKSATQDESQEEEEEEGAHVALDPAAVLRDATSSARESRDFAHTTSHQDPTAKNMGLGWQKMGLDTTPAEETRPRIDLYEAPITTLPISSNTSLAPTRAWLLSPEMTVGRIFEQSSPRNVLPSNPDELPFGLVDIRTPDQAPFSPQVYYFNIPTPDMTPPITRLPTPPLPTHLSTNSIVPNWTFSHDETTFARRLCRAALESAFHLFNSPNVRPGKLDHIFRLTLPFMSLDEIREQFKIILSRGTAAKLEFERSPFRHIGGAGTHYPSRGSHRRITANSNFAYDSFIGPVPLKAMTKSADHWEHPLIHVDMTGYEGEWFDPEDVQGYLEEEKGCYIDPRGSFAEVLIDVEEETTTADMANVMFSRNIDMDFTTAHRTALSQTDSTGLSGGSPGSTSSQSTSSMLDPFRLDMNVANSTETAGFSEMDMTAMFSQPLGMDLAAGFELNVNTTMTGFDTTSYPDTSNLLASAEPGLAVVKQKQKKAAWVDISKLIDELTKNGVCLGRVPGFRRELVDKAFQASLISAF